MVITQVDQRELRREAQALVRRYAPAGSRLVGWALQFLQGAPVTVRLAATYVQPDHKHDTATTALW